jgi:structural maintenance of chromosome 2
VVDTDQTGKLILKNGELKRKITIIPMNQIRPHTISDHVVKAAKKLVGDDNVFTALSLISYDPIYKPVMEFVFGSKFVCFNLETAKKVAFHPQIMTNTITLDGDHFDPDGVLTGGSRGERSNLLINLNQFNSQQEELNFKIEELTKLDEELNNEKEKSINYSRLNNELSLNEKQLNLAKMNLEQTSHHQKLARLESLKEEIKKMCNDIETEKKNLTDLNEKKIKLSESLNKDKDLESEKKLAQKKIDEAKKQLEKELKSNNNSKQEFRTISLEIDVLNKEIDALVEEMSKINENLNNYNLKLEELNQNLDFVQNQEREILQNLSEQRDKIKQKNALIDSKMTENDSLNKEKNKLELKLKEFNHRKNSLKEQLEESSKKLDILLKTNEWISEEKEMFSKENTIYDFKKQNMKEVHHRLNEIKLRKDKLSKQVDIRAMGMLAKKEEEYDELNKKRMIVLNDRSTLESTIDDLEKIKTQVLIKAFESINKDFGNIFKTLLPGAFAKLEHVNKSSLLDGVEFKVAFGDVWKESLTELSGGQRSLVALSLILSLLLYKPAPLYILDEVDAALDTSHTQNIGLMIKKYFKHSQVYY